MSYLLSGQGKFDPCYPIRIVRGRRAACKGEEPLLIYYLHDKLALKLFFLLSTGFNFDDDHFFNQVQNKIEEISENMTDPEKERCDIFSDEQTQQNGTICDLKNEDIDDIENENIDDLEKEKIDSLDDEDDLENEDIDNIENEKIYDDLDELETGRPNGREESDDTSGIFSLDVSDNEQKYKF